MQETLNVSLVQTELLWEDREGNLDRLGKIMLQIPGQTDLVILPETFTTGFSMKKEVADDGESTIAWMKETAQKSNVAIAGSFFVEDQGDYFNRLHFVQPDGSVSVYNKKHLFRLTNEQEVFTAGNQHVVVDFKGWKLSLQVCYDLRFPVWMRRTSENDYDAMIVVANWPERRSYAWKQLLIARAIENQSYVLAANRVGYDGTGVLHSGDSIVLSPMGELLNVSTPFKEEVVSEALDLNYVKKIREQLPFGGDADSFSLS